MRRPYWNKYQKRIISIKYTNRLISRLLQSFSVRGLLKQETDFFATDVPFIFPFFLLLHLLYKGEGKVWRKGN